MMMNRTEASEKLWLIVLLAVAGITFFLFCVWTPMRSDDYWVTLTFEHDDAGNLVYDKTGRLVHSTNRISCLYDWLMTWYHHRCGFMNGRLSDYVVSAILLTGGPILFKLLNTAVFLCVASGVARFCFGRLSVAGLSLSMAAMLVCLPRIVGTLLWMCGACNYLWGALLLLVVLLALRNEEKGVTLPLLWKAVAVVCAFLCGIWHEGLGATLCAGFILNGAVKLLQKQKPSSLYALLLLGVLLGSMVTLTAPAMWARSGVEGAGLKSLLMCVFFSSVPLLSYSFVLLVLAAVRFWKNPQSALSVLGGFILANLGLSALMGLHGDWGGAFFYLNFGLMLYILSGCKHLVLHFPKSVGVIFCCTCGLIAVCSAPRAYAIHCLHEGFLDNPPPPGQHLSVDVSRFGRRLPFQLSLSLPLENDKLLERSFCAQHGLEPFWVSFRNCAMPPSEYKVFECDKADALVARRINQHCVLRFPRGAVPVSYVSLLSTTGKELRLIAWREWDWFSIAVACVKGRKLDYMEKDYQNGFHYLVLPEQCFDYNRLRVEFKQNGEQSELTLSLPEALSGD